MIKLEFIPGIQGWFNILKSTNIFLQAKKKENFVIISREKTFDKPQYLFMIKSHSKLDIEENFLKLIKSLYENKNKTIANMILNTERLNVPQKTNIKGKMSTAPIPIQQCTWSSSQYNKARKRKKKVYGFEIKLSIHR